MAYSVHRIVRASLESFTEGVIELDRDWRGSRPPLLSMGRHCPTPGGLAPASMLFAGRTYGYFVRGEEMVFVLPASQWMGIDPARDSVYLAGDFNGWQDAVGRPEWRMHLA